ncbi:MAG: ABC-F family ATP-binding cassette domain-containing protein [Ruminococcaceae bacterium]|nr:ABC-F family ATP-binding cassette domain-containing protein [Oscillospiraceae bacterium]
MNLFNLSDVTKEFGERTLFQNVSFTIGDTDKIGLIGANGTGKTTLFKMLLEQESVSGGEIFRNKQTRLGYLEQHTNLSSDKTVLQEALSVFEDVMEMEAELAEIALQIEENGSDLDSLTRRQHALSEAFAAREGYTYQNRTRSALLGLGFTEAELSAPFATLSGGQKTRVALCRLLLSGANLLLLDEPTNHLDLKAIDWLEAFLRDYKGAFCLISHDRYFLDKVTNRTFALEYGKITVYEGNYTRYLALKAENEKVITRNFENTQKEIARLQGIVKQQRQWNREKNIKTAESKLKVIAKLEDSLQAPESEAPTLQFSLKAKPGGGQDVLILSDVSMSFGDNPLFSHANLTVRKGSRIFLLGPNGCGKTTLFKLILGALSPKSGDIRLGSNIFPGAYDQTQSDLSPDKTVFEEIADAHPHLTQTEIRNTLAAFLFRGDSVFSPISALSGGERARVSLAKLMLSDVNFLLLDEPTNHLDIDSRVALEQALEQYDGTLLIVSHDRYFINRLAHSVCYMTKDGLTLYHGNYDYFLEKQAETSTQSTQPAAAPVSEGKLSYQEQKQKVAEARKRENDLKKTEAEIEKTENRLAEIDALLSDNAIAADYEKAQVLTEEADALNEALLSLYEKWESLSE